MSSGWVYFIGTSGRNVIKIGHTRSNVDQRLKALQTASPVRLCLLAAVPASFRLEQQLHKKFQSQRLEGEWFELNDELRDLIEAAQTAKQRLLPTLRRSKATPKPEHISWTDRVLEIMATAPDETFNKKELAEIIGWGEYSSIPMALQSLYQHGRISRISKGRYQWRI